MSDLIQLNSHAKVNLGLCLLGKREDGYHELETLMHEIDLADEIYLRQAESTSLIVDDQVWDNQLGENLILKAKDAFEGVLGQSCGEWEIRVRKRIPMGSGMGGGSSNAITFLKYLQTLWPKELSEEVMDELAASMGSDTNFFIEGGSAVCRGRGEQVNALGKRFFYFNLMFPPFSCSTPKVFSKVKPPFDSCVDWEQTWKGKFDAATRNDLEQACCEAYPQMRDLLQMLRKEISGVCLSGSGSTLFTISESKNQSEKLFEQLKKLCGDNVQVVQAQSYLRA